MGLAESRANMNAEVAMDEGNKDQPGPTGPKSPESILARIARHPWARSILGVLAVTTSLPNATRAQADINQETAEAFSLSNPSAPHQYSDKGMPSQDFEQAVKQVRDINATKETLVSPEQQTLTEYSVKEFSISGNRIAALVETADDKVKVGVGDLDASGNLVLKEVGALPFAVLDIRVSGSDPNLMIAVGDKAPRAGRGQFAVSKNGGQTWEIKETGGLTAFRAFFTPDNKYAYIVEADPYQENQPSYRREALAMEAPMQVVKMVSSSPDAPVYPVYLSTQLIAASQPDIYWGYGSSPVDRGYFKMTFYPNGTVMAERFHEDQGFARGDLVTYQDQGQNWLWLVNNDTTAPDDENLSRGTVYLNVNDVNKDEVQEKLSSTDLIAFIGAFAADPKGGMGYIGSDIMISVDNRYRVGVEGFAIAAPNNIKQRVLFSKEGLPAPQSDKDSVQITSLGVAELGGKRFLVAGLTRWEWVLDSVKNAYSRKVIGGGLLVQDITGGASGDSPWKTVNFALKNIFSVYLPGLTKNHNIKGW